MLQFATIAQVVLGVLLLACLATWFQLFRRRKPNQPLLAMAPRPAVPWGLCHLLAALMFRNTEMIMARWVVGYVMSSLQLLCIVAGRPLLPSSDTLPASTRWHYRHSGISGYCQMGIV